MSPITHSILTKQKFKTLHDARTAVEFEKQKLTDAITLAPTPEDRTAAEKSAIAKAQALLAAADDSLRTLTRANDWLAEARAAIEFFDKPQAASRTASPGSSPASSARPNLPVLKIDRGPAITRQDFERLSHTDRNHFMAQGGRIVDAPSQATVRVA